MSKSLGNFFTIQEIFEKSPWPEAVTAEVLRYFLVSTHYRSPIDFSDEALQAAKAGLDNFYTMFQKLEEQTATVSRPLDRKLRAALKAFPKRFEAAMDDDFNSALAVGEMQQLRAVVNAVLGRGISRSSAQAVLKLFRKYGAVLGLFSLSTDQWTGSKEAASGLSQTEVERLIEERNEARRKKDWSRGDAIRQQLADAGVILEDRPDGTTRWRR